jgi:hypothetical protein
MRSGEGEKSIGGRTAGWLGALAETMRSGGGEKSIGGRTTV